MTTTTNTTTETPDVADLAQAIEARDAEGVTAWYADDATITIADHDHPPSAPLVIRGADEIRSYYRDVCGRNIQHEVRDLVASSTRLAFAQHCRYPDGGKVLCITTATLDGDRIVGQTAVQVWDS